LLIQCIIPHISRPAKGTIITAQRSNIFISVLSEAVQVFQLKYIDGQFLSCWQ
jgi:hypothetical protein